ncbi:hypothetical protein CGSHiHH_09295 [Haemophilus influenzae PittHH]|nr:hypothetical protein CGSHiHH_09295 [Haemophilus influenzae PittHH]
MAAEKLNKKTFSSNFNYVVHFNYCICLAIFLENRKFLLIFKTNELFPINFACHILIYTYNSTPLSLGGEIGRRSGFKIRR